MSLLQMENGRAHFSNSCSRRGLYQSSVNLNSMPHAVIGAPGSIIMSEKGEFIRPGALISGDFG
ncbi:hypothetical protein BofuT4_P017970.1 [Botrytis cinerea T4]|uniref:Uncharacterized protein n=1 Tax=Botryotinia fuckeliana (strain T4) TaxID=999810 RepID=G2YIF4_BOTF4|nr:hypothetical protein BofuT4_P017970.1 [Botrytis cinerea T4]